MRYRITTTVLYNYHRCKKDKRQSFLLLQLDKTYTYVRQKQQLLDLKKKKIMVQNYSIILTITMVSFVIVGMMMMMMEVNAFGCHYSCTKRNHFNHNHDWKQKQSVVLFMTELEERDEKELLLEEEIMNSIQKDSNTIVTIKKQSAKPSLEYMMQAMGTSRRRLVIGGLSSIGIALVGNLFGVTSSLLQTIPEDIVERSKLDTYYGRGDYKRFTSEYYTLLLPKNWVADSTLELQKAQLRVRTLDYTMTNTNVNNIMNLPDAAFGPAGNTMQRTLASSDTNVSILVSKVQPFESLQRTLGTPQQAADYLLTKFKSPNRVIPTLISAYERNEDGSYQMEYIIDRTSSNNNNNRPSLQAISIIAPSLSHDTIITMTIIAPQSDWEKDDTKLLKMADSFQIKK